MHSLLTSKFNNKNTYLPRIIINYLPLKLILLHSYISNFIFIKYMEHTNYDIMKQILFEQIYIIIFNQLAE